MCLFIYLHLNRHARIQEVLSEGFCSFDVFFFVCFFVCVCACACVRVCVCFFSCLGEGGSKYHYKRAIIGPPAKRHLNGVPWRADDGPKVNGSAHE